MSSVLLGLKSNDIKFLHGRLVGSGRHAGILWTNIVTDRQKLSGCLIEALLWKLIRLEDLVINMDVLPDFTLLVTSGSPPILPPSLKFVALLFSDDLHGDLCIS